MSMKDKPTLAERLRHEDSMNPDRDEYRHEVLGRAADALERLAAIDEVLRGHVDPKKYKTGDMMDCHDQMYVDGRFVIMDLINQNLLPQTEVAAVKLPDIECSGCKKVIPDDDAMPCDMCGGSVCCSCTGEDGACKRCTDKCCTTCWYFKKECICNKAEVAADE